MIQFIRAINDQTDHIHQKRHSVSSSNSIAASIAPFTDIIPLYVTTHSPTPTNSSPSLNYSPAYFIPAYRLFFLISFPYLKKTYGNGAITSVNIANKNVAH
jgi:hypothetical protein